MHGETMKFINAQQARPYNNFKNTKLKLLKTNAAIWYNKICRDKQLKPAYVNIKLKGNRQQDRNTENNAIRFRISQEIKFLHKKKQHLNQLLYRSHLECAHQYNGTWQYIQMIIHQNLQKTMEHQYHKLNKMLHKLTNRNTRRNTQKATQFQPRIVNLTGTNLTKEQNRLLSLGPNYAIEKETQEVHQ
jgi:hypothetical protein